ncbi:MAG TPA: hypothetical protein VHS31_10170, partial [Tepidisphaeraceae bacterium]|nr:hypothetical protein [Tepidisphaeraceae bacterium]
MIIGIAVRKNAKTTQEQEMHRRAIAAMLSHVWLKLSHLAIPFLPLSLAWPCHILAVVSFLETGLLSPCHACCRLLMEGFYAAYR